MTNPRNLKAVKDKMKRPELDVEAAEYERELSDAELVGLTLDVSRRASALLAQGVPLPMQEIENHHIIGLLECFVGPEDSLRVKEWHLSWLDRMLDAVEAQVRAHIISSGLVPGPVADKAGHFVPSWP